MESHKATDVSGGDKWFHVTDAGVKHVDEHSPKPPKIRAREGRAQI